MRSGDKWVSGQIHRKMNGWVEGGSGRWMGNRQAGGWVDEQTHRGMDGWINKWRNEWMDR